MKALDEACLNLRGGREEQIKGNKVSGRLQLEAGLEARPFS